ncbi:restriction endonuclease subunit S [Collinsella intestinalis]|uniref:restriction endonuclease subunit S n=1 Tax=Collinsella intestinalis TaxID=147207 RepID=UPI00195E16A0|nr:restriction endonuclease subunit S [Collinsella intestinalis]
MLSDESIADEVPFELPTSWSWVRMETILTFINGRAYKKSELLDHGKYRVLRVGNLFTNTSWYYSDLELDPSKYCHHGDLLYAWSASFGPTVWSGGDCIFHYHIWKIEHSELLDRKYLYWALLQDVVRVKSATTGSTMIHVSMEHMKPRLLPLPPLAEQRRIAERVSELMPLVEGYGELEDAREELDAALPGRLRRSVLREAVRGRLAPQDASDEPAGELLGRIREERRRLAAEGRIRLPKGGDSVILTGSDGRRYEKRLDAKGRESEPVCIEDEIPFEIPDGWAWARLKSLGSIVGGGTPKTNDSSLWAEADDGIPWITPADMRNVSDMQVSHGSRFLSEIGLSSSSAQLLPPGSVVMSSRAPIGYLAITACALATNQGFKSLVPVERSLSKWVLVCLDALMEDIKRRASGTIFKEISGSEFGETLVPIAPLVEQARILAELNRLSNETA